MFSRWIASLMLLAGGFLVARAQDVPAWRLVWSDEFDQANGTGPSSSKWAYDTGGGGWGNKELETYTARRANSFIEDGKLVIAALKETFTGTDGIVRNYTSARLKTQSTATWTYGRIEARMKLPAGQGIWPAFWMLGANINQVSWPACGELDIMENIGKEPSAIHSVVHGPGYSGGEGIGKTYTLSGGRKFSSDFHLFAVEWEANSIRWLMDNQVYFTVTPANLPAGTKWVFDKPQFLILNLAVGGTWPGAPDATTVFPQRLTVDYVRVYARSTAPAPELLLKALPGSVEARWPTLFPGAFLEGTEEMAGPWRRQTTSGQRVGQEFIATVPPGYYRLRW